MTDCELLVIGSGPAGVSAVAAYLEAGGSGPVLVVTSDTDEPYERPPLSKEILADATAPEPSPLTGAELPQRAELRLGTTVTRLDLDAKEAQLGDAETVRFAKLVLALGARPLPFPSADAEADVHLLRSMADARRLVQAAQHARTAVVIGSGFIGCEAAASLARRGLATTMVTPEPAPQVDRLGAYAADRITSWLTDLGVEVRTGVKVTGIRAPRTVHLDDGTTLSPDLILSAIGVEPATDVLDGTDLQLHQGRVVADAYLEAAPGVWVAGDAARAHHGSASRPIEVEHWGDALGMGEIAGRNAAAEDGDATTWADVPGFWSTIGTETLKYAAWGDGHETAEVVERPGGFTVWYADEAGVVVGALTYNADDDYERATSLIGEGVTLAEALRG